MTQLSPSTPLHVSPKRKKTPSRSTIMLFVLSLALGITIIGASGALWYLYDQNQQLQAALRSNQGATEFQKEQKDAIRNLWENQTALNDDLIFLQIQLFNRLELYQKQLTETFSYENGRFVQTTDINRANFKKAEDDVYNTLKEIDDTINSHADAKAQAKSEIDDLYIKAEEDQKNRINYTNGLQ